MLSRYLVSMAFCITAGMVGSMTPTAIAEEKEKNTLRTLMLANVSAGHILASRGIVAFASIAVVDAVCFAVLDVPADQMGSYLLISLLGSVPIVMIALLLGLAARDQMTAGLYSLPHRARRVFALVLYGERHARKAGTLLPHRRGKRAYRTVGAGQPLHWRRPPAAPCNARLDGHLGRRIRAPLPAAFARQLADEHRLLHGKRL
ncbi:MAG: ABC transporter permease [Gordonibacter pamelaeae]